MVHNPLKNRMCTKILEDPQLSQEMGVCVLGVWKCTTIQLLQAARTCVEYYRQEGGPLEAPRGICCGFRKPVEGYGPQSIECTKIIVNPNSLKKRVCVF